MTSPWKLDQDGSKLIHFSSWITTSWFLGCSKVSGQFWKDGESYCNEFWRGGFCPNRSSYVGKTSRLIISKVEWVLFGSTVTRIASPAALRTTSSFSSSCIGSRLKSFESKRWSYIKVGCAFLMVAVTMLPHAECGRNDYREDAPHFTYRKSQFIW